MLLYLCISVGINIDSDSSWVQVGLMPMNKADYSLYPMTRPISAEQAERSDGFHSDNRKPYFNWFDAEQKYI